MPKPKGTHWIVTANFIDGGSPAYLRPDGSWSEVLNEAEPIESDAEKDQKLERAMQQERIVCDPYVFQVCLTPTGIDPLTARETIRSTGPTTRIRRPDSSPEVDRAQ